MMLLAFADANSSKVPSYICVSPIQPIDATPTSSLRVLPPLLEYVYVAPALFTDTMHCEPRYLRSRCRFASFLRLCGFSTKQPRDKHRNRGLGKVYTLYTEVGKLEPCWC